MPKKMPNKIKSLLPKKALSNEAKLFLAIVEGNPTKVSHYLEEKGANPNATENGIPALVYAYNLLNENKKGVVNIAKHNNYISIIKLLLQNGANPNIQINPNGTTLLMSACSSNTVEIVDLLLQHCANPNTMDENKQTALSVTAALSDHEKVMELLLSRARSDAKKAALEIAIAKNNKEAVNLLLAANTIKPAISKKMNDTNFSYLWMARKKADVSGDDYVYCSVYDAIVKVDKIDELKREVAELRMVSRLMGQANRSQDRECYLRLLPKDLWPIVGMFSSKSRNFDSKQLREMTTRFSNKPPLSTKPATKEYSEEKKFINDKVIEGLNNQTKRWR